MYSATFALTVIIVIALTNLFLGFATAILMGRGPKRWSDVDRAIVLQPFPLELVMPRRKAKVERIEIGTRKAPIVVPVEPDLPAATPVPAPASKPAQTPQRQPSPTATAARQALPAQPPFATDGDANSRKFVLSNLSTPPADDDDPPETILNRQLDAWRASELSDECPSISGLTVDVRDLKLDVSLRSLLMSQIRSLIVRQLRKDRRVLEIAANQFAWFSCDVAPSDALMPVERIRQMLNKTRFHHHGKTIQTTVTAGVVAGTLVDTAGDLVKRLQLAMAYAREQGESPTYLDKGQGPNPVTPFTLEVEESERDLAG